MTAWMVAPAAASLLGSALSYKGASDANEANREIMREQMAFQERMSSTAHQREVADLRAAGLNPILSSKYGGASTPSGASAVMQNAFAGASDNLRNGVSSAVAGAQAEATIDQIREQTELTKVQRANVAADTLVKYAEEGNKNAQTQLTHNQSILTDEKWATERNYNQYMQPEEVRNLRATGDISRANLATAKAAAAQAEITEDMMKEYPVLRQIRMLLDVFGGAPGAARDVASARSLYKRP